MTAGNAPLRRVILASALMMGAVALAAGSAQGTGPGAAPTVTPQSAGRQAAPTGRSAGPSDGRMPGPWGWEWWNDAEVQKEVGLSPEKVKRIHDIYTRRSEQLRPLRDEFMKELTSLDKVTRARTVDEATYALQVTKVEGLRSELNKSRTVMLYSLFRELSPEQYRQLQDVRDRRERDRDRGRGPQPK